jgi:hypothetical protein
VRRRERERERERESERERVSRNVCMSIGAKMNELVGTIVTFCHNS